MSIRRAEEILNFINSQSGMLNQQRSQLEVVRCAIIRSLLPDLEILEKETALIEKRLEKPVERSGQKEETKQS